MTKRIEKILRNLPVTPGVYQFLNAKKTIIYVGKAANLRSRVQSYFSRPRWSGSRPLFEYEGKAAGRGSAGLSPAKQQMVDAVRDIRIIPTASEIEALLLEANLIKKLQPHYNVTLRDDKSYLYVKISTEEEWPRVLTTRTLDRSGTYFGPFTSAHAVREVLRVLRKFLPYRCKQKAFYQNLQRSYLCKFTEIRSPKVRACLWHHLGLCPGTCIGAITNKDYQKIIRRIILFFEGRMDELKRAMKRELGPDRVLLMENVLAHTRVLSVGEQYASDTRDLVRVLGIPSLHRIEGYDISNIMGCEATGSMVVFIDGEPAKSEYKKFKIKTVHRANDVAMLEEVLMRRLMHSDIQRSYLCMEIRSLNIWPLPDLMIIDGGKAQLNAAVRALRPNKGHPCNTRVTLVIAIAKGGHGGVLAQKEEIYFPYEKNPLKLPNASPALHLILRVRDEAHRFAVGYHRRLRRKRFFSYNTTPDR